MSIVNAVPLLEAAGGDYTISRSVRLRSSASAYLNRTFGTPTNEKIWTWSAWVKRGALGNLLTLFSASTGASPAYDGFRFNSSDQLQFFTNGASTVSLVTTAVFRDPSAWYHIVLSYNATTTTVTIYVNGVAQTTTGTNISNTTYSFNHASTLHTIGTMIVNGSPQPQYIDSYLTEINFIDGQALTPSSFGTTNALTGVWQPAKYTGTYGTNGFYLNFSSNGTSAALGTDFSGNSNTWTVNNVSVTAGATYDSMLDSPTVSAVSSNYAVLNPLSFVGSPTYLNANLTYTTSADALIKATIGVSSGKWYWECVVVSGTGSMFGLATVDSLSTYCGGSSSSWGYFSTNGNKYTSAAGSAYGASYTTGDIIGVAFDADNGTLTFYKNNTSQGTAFTGLTGNTYTPAFGNSANSNSINFGQRPFTYTPPTGFVALNTYNLPASTITNGAAYMAATLYTGNGSAGGQTITNSVSGISFKPDFVWLKGRSAISEHELFNSIAGGTKYLVSNNTSAEQTGAGITFNSNGFSLAGAQYNDNALTVVSWQWLAGGGTSSSNTNGSITSTVSVGATQGFSVVTYTGTGANATVGHGLGVAPSMIIAKHRNAADNWIVYHTALGGSPNYLWLNLTSSAGTSSAVWNTFPTSSVFGVGTDNLTNLNGGTYVAYCWAQVAGFSKFGSYTGNGSADGPFIYTGFRPRWIMVKDSSTAQNWFIQDTSRDTYNQMNDYLNPNSSAAESAFGSGGIDVTANGFKIRTTSIAINTSGSTLIFAAFAEVPFKLANAS